MDRQLSCFLALTHSALPLGRKEPSLPLLTSLFQRFVMTDSRGTTRERQGQELSAYREFSAFLVMLRQAKFKRPDCFFFLERVVLSKSLPVSVTSAPSLRTEALWDGQGLSRPLPLASLGSKLSAGPVSQALSCLPRLE